MGSNAKTQHTESKQGAVVRRARTAESSGQAENADARSGRI
jgi:hypothetical protein